MRVQSCPRVREWLLRYGPAELLSLLTTLAAAEAARRARGSDLHIALAATWAGNLSYFGLILGQDVSHTYRALAEVSHRYTIKAFGSNLRALFVEFGAAEALDSLLIRPALMYSLPKWLHSMPLGVLAAKFGADITFYVPAIAGYELSKRTKQNTRRSGAGIGTAPD